MRSIKRNRQIEDLVFDKLQKRGFIENGEENANFVKNLQLEESIEKMSERAVKRRTRSSLSQEGVFSTSRSLEEFLAFADYDLFPWLNEVKQILQIHVAYKIAMDSCCLESLLTVLEKDFGEHQRLDFVKNQLTEEVYSTLQNQQDCSRITKLVNSGDYTVFIQSKTDIKVHPEEYAKFCSFVARFPIIVSILFLSIEFDTNIEESQAESTSDISPLTPPEHEPVESPEEPLFKFLPQIRELTDTFLPYISDIDHFAFSMPRGVTCCAASFNKKFIACCRSDAITTLVDVKRKVEINLKSHSGPVFASAFLSHSDYLLTGGRDRTVRLWNTSKFVESRDDAVSLDFIYNGHTSHVTDIAVSSLDLYFATASDDTTARLWRIESEQYLRAFVGHLDSLNAVVFHPNSNYLLTGSDDGSVRLWDVNTAKCQRVFGIAPKGEQGSVETPVLSVSMNPNGREVAASYRDGTIRVFDLKEGKTTVEYATNQMATKLCYNATGSLLASISDKNLRIWNSTSEICKIQPIFSEDSSSAADKSLVSVYFEGTGDITLISS